MFLENRLARRGAANPERMTHPVWLEIIQREWSAYAASKHYGAETGCEIAPGWCFERFGRAEVELPDGRRVLIGGEHEDSYDPDFFIYNDVVVVEPSGNTEIYGYSPEAFPPTDFHSATLINDEIVVVGSLGYPENRIEGTTQVGFLDLRTWQIRMIATTGEGPGWIHGHSAQREDGTLRVTDGEVWTPGAMFTNVDDWKLDLRSGIWSRLTARPFEEWVILRENGEGIDMARLSIERINVDLACFDIPRFEGLPDDIRRLLDESDQEKREALGLANGSFDPEIYDTLFVFPFEATRLEHGEEDTSEATYDVDGAIVRLEISFRSLEIKIRGQLDASRRDSLLQHITETLSKLIGSCCRAVRTASSESST